MAGPRSETDMFARRKFLNRCFGKNTRPIEETDDFRAKAAAGMLVMTPFLGANFYFLRASVGWVREKHYDADLPSVTVPLGFVTDLTSIPRILWPLLPRDSDYAQPAVVHDFQYWQQREPKDVADRTFRLGMRELGVARWKCLAIYHAVSVFGTGAWRKNATLKKSGERRILRDFPQRNVTWGDWKNRQPSPFFD